MLDSFHLVSLFLLKEIDYITIKIFDFQFMLLYFKL